MKLYYRSGAIFSTLMAFILSLMTFTFCFAQDRLNDFQNKAHQEIQLKIDDVAKHSGMKDVSINWSATHENEDLAVVKYQNKQESIHFSKDELTNAEKQEFSDTTVEKVRGALDKLSETGQPSPGMKK